MSTPVMDEFGTVSWRDAVGRLHREGGLPAVERVSGTREWWVNGQTHRESGLPAVEWFNGNKAWYERGLRHREDGPAVEWPKVTEWWLHGEEVTAAQHAAWRARRIRWTAAVLSRWRASPRRPAVRAALAAQHAALASGAV